jgi:Fe-Mn family superoxide dismutase
MYQLPPLPYAHEALAPVINAETMHIHHGKHHARYVTVTNELIPGSTDPLEDVIAAALRDGKTKLFNNAAQAWNHAFFWASMAPSATQPGSALQRAIDSTFGSLDKLGEQFIAEGGAHFGSGWVWLLAQEGKLKVVSSHDAGQPWLTEGGVPLLVCDVWEHAYYLDYKNDRAQFLKAWFGRLANWEFATAQLNAASGDGERFRYPRPTA